MGHKLVDRGRHAEDVGRQRAGGALVELCDCGDHAAEVDFKRVERLSRLLLPSEASRLLHDGAEVLDAGVDGREPLEALSGTEKASERSDNYVA